MTDLTPILVKFPPGLLRAIDKDRRDIPRTLYIKVAAARLVGVRADNWLRIPDGRLRDLLLPDAAAAREKSRAKERAPRRAVRSGTARKRAASARVRPRRRTPATKRKRGAR